MIAYDKLQQHTHSHRHNRARLSKVPVLAAAVNLWLMPLVSHADEPLDYTIELTTARNGFDGKKCWVHARAGVIPPGATGNPTETPLVVMTLNELLLSGSDVFYATNDMRSTDLGRTWDGPRAHTATMGRRKEPDGVEVAPCDLTPRWHAATGKLLCTGQDVRYRGDRGPMHVRRREVIFSVYDPATPAWSSWQTLAMPDLPRFQNAGAGSTQRLDLPDGEILLPIYFKRPEEQQSGRNLGDGNRMDATLGRRETRQRQQPLRSQDPMEPAESAREVRDGEMQTGGKSYRRSAHSLP